MGSNDDTPREDEILTACAIRFDGYAYAEKTNFNAEAAFAKLLKTRKFPSDDNQAMCLFFSLQRYLFKWGGEYLEQDSPEWWCFRELFLRLFDKSIPEEFRHAEWHEIWESQFKPSLETCAAVVRSEHEGTQYNTS